MRRPSSTSECPTQARSSFTACVESSGWTGGRWMPKGSHSGFGLIRRQRLEARGASVDVMGVDGGDCRHVSVAGPANHEGFHGFSCLNHQVISPRSTSEKKGIDRRRRGSLPSGVIISASALILPLAMMATPSRAMGHPRPSPGSGAETTGRARGSEQARAPGRTCAGRLSSCSGTILEFSMIMETALPHVPKGAKVRTIPKSKIRPREPAFGRKWGQMSLGVASIDRTSVLGADFGIALERKSGPFFCRDRAPATDAQRPSARSTAPP